MIRHPLLRRARVLAAVPLFWLSLAAIAGDFFETNGVAVDGYDVVNFHKDRKAVRGHADFSATHKGSLFHFTSAEHRDAFRAEPERYAPQYHGYCAFGVSRGYKAATSPDSFSIVDGRLYLNYNREVQAMWSRDKAGYIEKAEAAWPTVSLTTKVLR